MAKLATVRGRVRWTDLCRDDGFRGRWVAMEEVRCEAGTPVEGQVVDSDEDLAALCSRIQSSERPACAIYYCDDHGSGVRRALH